MTTGKDIQIENGNWYKMDRLLEAKLITALLTSQEQIIIRSIILLTYGHKPSMEINEIGLQDIADISGIDKKNLWRDLEGLIEKSIIIREGGGRGRGKKARLGINKYFEHWQVDWRDAPGTENYASKRQKRKPEKSTTVDYYEGKEKSTTVDYYEPEKSTTVDYYANKSLPPAAFYISAIEVTNIEEQPIETPMAEKAVVFVDDFSANGIQKKEDPNEADDAMNLVKEAYQRVDQFGVNFMTPRGKAVLALALRLVETYGFETCLRELTTVRDSHETKISAGEHGIVTPINYLAGILDRKAKELVSKPYTNGASPPEAPKASNVVDFYLKDIFNHES